MITKRIALVTTAIAVGGAGGAAAIAATVKDDRKAAESAILSDAAKELNVSPSDLKSALGDAQDDQIDQAVKDGKITKEQGEAMKKRRAEEGTVLGRPGGRHGGGRGHRGGPRGGLFGATDAAAKVLGMTQAELKTEMRSGKTLTEITKAKGKYLADVKKAVRAAASDKLDAAVKDGKMTAAQRTEALKEFDEHFDEFAAGKGKMGRRGQHGPGGKDAAEDPAASDTQPGVYPSETATPSGQAA